MNEQHAKRVVANLMPRTFTAEEREQNKRRNSEAFDMLWAALRRKGIKVLKLPVTKRQMTERERIDHGLRRR